MSSLNTQTTYRMNRNELSTKVYVRSRDPSSGDSKINSTFWNVEIWDCV